MRQIAALRSHIDGRINSDAFARRSAEVLSASGGGGTPAFPSLRPTPVLSSCRMLKLGCMAGINITASHNPSAYNGYRAYREDGAQLPPDHAKCVSDAMDSIDIFKDVPAPEKADKSKIITVSDLIDEPYVECVLEQRVNPDAITAVAERSPNRIHSSSRSGRGLIGSRGAQTCGSKESLHRGRSDGTRRIVPDRLLSQSGISRGVQAWHRACRKGFLRACRRNRSRLRPRRSNGEGQGRRIPHRYRKSDGRASSRLYDHRI